MKIHIKAYGIAREIMGGSSELEFAGTTVHDLRRALLVAHPELAGLSSLLVAVNQNYASDDVLVAETDEVVLIPPVSGG